MSAVKHHYALRVKRRYLHQVWRYRAELNQLRDELYFWLRNSCHHQGPTLRMQRMLLHAFDSCSFYRQRWSAAGFVRADMLRDEVLELLPVVRRRDLMDSPLASSELAEHELSDLFVGRTSGSTGEPLRFVADALHNFSFWPFVQGMARYHQVAGGQLTLRPFLTEVVQLCGLGHSPEYSSLLPALRWVRAAKWHAQKPDTVGRIEAAQPAIVTGDPDSLLLLLSCRVRPQLVLSSAYTLPADTKHALETHLGCPVVDYYSAQETGPLAFACRLGFGHHVLAPFCSVSTVGDELVVSHSRNRAFPLIRYALGDSGVVRHVSCECGIVAPTLVSLSGRSNVRFRTHRHEVFDPRRLTPLLTRMAGLQAHSLVELARGKYVLRMEGRVVPDEVLMLRRSLDEHFGAPTQLTVEQHVRLFAPSQKPTPFVGMANAGDGWGD